MATLAELADRTFDILYGVAKVARPAEDTISGALTDSDTAVTPATTAMWKRGDYAEFADGEVVIFAADSSGSTAIRREQRGSTAAAHADGSVILKNPWPLRVSVERHIGDVVLNELWPHVWSWHNGTITFTAGDHLYDLPQYVEDVAAVEQADVDSDGVFRPVPTTLWDVERRVASTIATNGALLRLRSPYAPDETVYYRGKRRPHPDDLANLDGQLEPMIAWCAAAKCFAGSAGAATADRTRIQNRDSRESTSMYQMLMSEFLRMRGDYARQLIGEVPQEMRFRRRFRVPY